MALARVLFVTRGVGGEFDPGSANQEAALQFLPLFGLFWSLVLIFLTLADCEWSRKGSGGEMHRIYLHRILFGIFVIRVDFKTSFLGTILWRMLYL